MKISEFRTITPHLTVRGASEAIEFYRQAFAAEQKYCLHTPDNKAVMHAELQIGNSMIYLNDEFPDVWSQSPIALNSSPVTIHLQVDDADAWFNRAVAAGAKVLMPLENTFWGDRYGKVVDPFGHHWSIGCQVENLSPQEVQQRAAQEFAQT